MASLRINPGCDPAWYGCDNELAGSKRIVDIIFVLGNEDEGL